MIKTIFVVFVRKEWADKWEVLSSGQLNKMKIYAKYKECQKAGMLVRFAITGKNTNRRVFIREGGSSNWQQQSLKEIAM